MSVYNLYLLDESRDPRVIARTARITGLPARVVRRELTRPPFLLLREHPLSRAVAVRREYEQLGLSLRLERVEEPGGDSRHPLFGLEAPEDGEIVLEPGSGFRELDAQDGQQGEAAGGPPRRRWIWLSLAAVLLLLFAGGALLLRRGLSAAGSAPDRALPRLSALLQVELPAQASRLRALLAAPVASPESLRQAGEDALQLESIAHGIWNRLPAGLQRQVEELQAMRLTAELRREGRKEDEISPPPAASGAPREGVAPREEPPLRAGHLAVPAGESFWIGLDAELSRREVPPTMAAQLRLERLLQRMEELRSQAPPPQLEQLARTLSGAGPEAEMQLQARALAGSIQRKGLQWVPSGMGIVARADLPEETRIDVVDEGGRLHRARIEDGRLLFEGSVEGWRPLAARLAPLSEQPPALQRVLEAGLRLYAPEVYFATLPGSTLARQREAVVEAQLAGGEARRLHEALLAEGLRSAELDAAGNLRGELPAGEGLLDLLSAVGRIYQEARHWPTEIELSRGEERWRLSGCELWLLSSQP
jgi:hypothetical protein